MVHGQTPPDAARRGRYRLVRRIGRGGMGEVWLAAIDNPHGVQSQFALKVLHPEILERPGHRAMLVDEARIASRIQSPHTVRVIELLDDEVGLCIVMEWCDGTPLSRILADGPLPLGVALRIAADACAGLHAAHELRSEDGTPLDVVHRDVSPPNLLVDRTGVTKLLDFGIAKARGRVSKETTSGVKGRASYMSLEQAKAGPIDRRADVFAVGVVLYEMLTAEHPFGASDDLGALVALSSKAPPKPLPSSIPGVVATIVKRALSHDPSKRFATAADMRSEIEAAMIDCNVVTDSTEVARVVEARPSVQRLRAATSIAPSSVPQGLASVPPPMNVAAPAPAPTTPPPSRGRGWVAVLVGAIALGAAVTVALRLLRPSSDPQGSPSSAVSTPASAPTSTAGAVTSASAVASAPPAPPPPSPLDIDSLTPPPTTRRPGVATSSTPPTGSASAALPSCDPPWYVDSAGHRVYWKHCLRGP